MKHDVYIKLDTSAQIHVKINFLKFLTKKQETRIIEQARMTSW